jgi:hypothetical protein
MNPIKVLVFPCGSEIGLEIGRSLDHLKEVKLWGASSVADHGRFAFDRYVDGLPMVTDPGCVTALNRVVDEHGIDCIFPAMDVVLELLAAQTQDLHAPLIGSTPATIAIARSKKRTYEALAHHVRCPTVHDPTRLDDLEFPVFLKPDKGYGSIGARKVGSAEAVVQAIEEDPSLMVLEHLPGKEYTVDCFSNFDGDLVFAGPRERCRVSKGISVHTKNVPDDTGEFFEYAKKIHQVIPFNGCWFFQVKRAKSGELALLEMAPRVSGSMGLHRCKGVNLPLMSVFNHLKIPCRTQENSYDVEYDRAFYNRVRINHPFTTLYLDFDDCLYLQKQYLHPVVMRLIVDCRNAKRPVVLVSRHQGDLHQKLIDLGVRGLFNDVVHITSGESKVNFMNDARGILVDDSFAERQSAIDAGITALGPDAVEALLL